MRDAMVCGRDASSSCAGIRTVTVTGPAKTPEVLAITSFGASGSDWASTERRERLEIRSSSSATPETSRAASATAETATRADGAAVAYRTLQNPRRIPSLGGDLDLRADGTRRGQQDGRGNRRHPEDDQADQPRERPRAGRLLVGNRDVARLVIPILTRCRNSDGRRVPGRSGRLARRVSRTPARRSLVRALSRAG